MRKATRLAVLAAACASALAGAAPAAGAEDLTTLVNPLSGTLGAGFPVVGASLPFGMVQLGPNTGMPGMEDPVTYDGYGYQDSLIRGFGITHFDGAGIPIAGDLPIMPTTGAVGSTDPSQYASPYSHAAETAQPGYYAVDLQRYRTHVELTATERTGALRFTFPSNAQANVIVNAGQSIGHTHPATVTAVGDRELDGSLRSDVGYTLWFTIVFDRPFASAHPFAGGEYITFDATSQPEVESRVGISYVDLAGAKANLAAEAPPSRSFDTLRRAAHDAWAARLGDIEVSGGDPGQRETFYTNLYRALTMPSLFDDADGRYLGFDGAVHQVAPGEHHYTNLSLWDTYRTQTPLLSLVEPQVAHDIAKSLVDDADQNDGVIPRWTQANRDRGIMGGDSGTATLAELVAEGALDATDSAHAYDLLLAQATKVPPVWPRSHLDDDIALGYVPAQDSDIAAPLTQEYAIDDAAVAAVARRLGDSANAAMLERRAGNWRNLIDPQRRFVRPRNRDGSWANPTALGPLSTWDPVFQDGYQEETGWQALWAEPHDVAGLADAIGGRQVALDRLERFFSAALQHPASPAAPVVQQYSSFFGVYYIGTQFTPANETDLQTPWYFNWLGQPWKTQKVARAELNVYSSRPDGLPGNDDTGTMSAWYVLDSLGLYHAAPASGAWELSSPAFASAVVHRGRGAPLRIDAAGASSAVPYIQNSRLDGAALDRTYLTSCELRSAHRLSYGLGPLPDRTWATGAGAAPPSLSDPGSRSLADGCDLIP